MVLLSHPYMTTGKTIAFTRRTFVGKVMSLHFNMLSRLVIAFLPSSKLLLISWLQSPSAVILEPNKTSVTVSIVSTSICHEVMGPDAWFLFSECWVLSQLFHSPLSLSSRGFSVPLHSAMRVVSSAYLRLLYFSWQSWSSLCFIQPSILHDVFWMLEKAMVPHSSTLAWKIPWMEKPGRLQSMGSQRVRHEWSELAAAAAFCM